MTLATKLAWDDTVLPFQLDASDIRGRVARLDGVLDGVLKQHDYPPQVEALVAEMALLTALIGQTVKLRWKLSLQVQSKGPVRMIATDYFAPTKEGEPALIRAYASFDADRLSDSAPFDQIGEGYFAILIDQGKGTTPYQGITPLDGPSLSACAAAYFAQSEQLPTRFALSFGVSTEQGAAPRWRGGGVMIQHMPKASPFAAGGEGTGGILQAADLVSGDTEENWNRVNILLDSVEELELVGPVLPLTDLLVRLFHEEYPRVFDAQSVRFGCTCSEDRVRQSLSIYSARDIEKMTTDDGRVTADCQFAARITISTRRRSGLTRKRDPVTRLEAQLTAALSGDGAGSSDFDLNPDFRLPEGRRLTPAGVLVAISVVDDTPRLILTKRSSALQHHPGQIAFPGGKQDVGDADVAAAALREAREEIGLPEHLPRVLGQMPAHETVTGFLVTPVVAMVEQEFDPVPEPGEVDEVFSVPLAHVLDPANYVVESRRWRGLRRHYYVVPYGPYYIWGATARMLRMLADRMGA